MSKSSPREANRGADGNSDLPLGRDAGCCASVCDFDVVSEAEELSIVPMKRLNKSGIVCRIPQGLANFVHCGIQSMLKIDEGISGPKALSQLLPRDQLARTRKQRCKNLKGLFLKLESLPLPAQLAAAQISFVLTEANCCGALIHVGRIAPQVERTRRSRRETRGHEARAL
jgi:hypothetical protein